MRAFPATFIASTALLLAAAGPKVAFGQSPPAAPGPPLALQQISSTLFQLGNVRFDKAAKTVRFPARLNMSQGPLEYILVMQKGKLHESLLKTEIEPYHLQLALLLLGVKGAPPTVELQTLPYEPYRLSHAENATNAFSRIVLSGDKLSILVSWKEDDALKSLPVEDCIFNDQSKHPASRGPWIYNGSRVVNGAFMAQREGSIVALVDDPEAMVNNPRAGHNNDQIWLVNTNCLPPQNTPLEVTFKWEGPGSAEPKTIQNPK